MAFTIAFPPGVTLTRWTTAWEQRRRSVPLAFVAIDDPVAALRDGTADVAFVRLPVDRDGLSVIPLYAEQQVVVAPKDHPIADVESVTLAELDGEDRVAGEPAAAVELVAAGGGIVILPHSVARMHARKDLVSRPVGDAEPTTVALVWPEEKTTADVEEWIGIVRGRTANSSRGAVQEPQAEAARKGSQRRAAPARKKPHPGRRRR